MCLIGLSNKLVDRHPHVFGDVKADTPGDVLRNWQALKAEEKKKRDGDGRDTETARLILSRCSQAFRRRCRR